MTLGLRAQPSVFHQFSRDSLLCTVDGPTPPLKKSWEINQLTPYFWYTKIINPWFSLSYFKFWKLLKEFIFQFWLDVKFCKQCKVLRNNFCVQFPVSFVNSENNNKSWKTIPQTEEGIKALALNFLE